MENLLKTVAATKANKNWEKMSKRQKPLYSRNTDIRSEFERDYTRIIHSTAYRRMKHKTQVFFSPKNDHICTRIEHIVHVESISYTIAKYFGLNTELTKAIAIAHDIGHSPFGHQGEKVLSELSKKDIGDSFWHERNGLEIVDKIELLDDLNGNKRNMDLTYSVRDGIISHCGEIDENGLKPRNEYINLDEYKYPNQFAPYTWEACVVKIADKIAYLGRDILDAITLGILDNNLKELYQVLDMAMSDTLNNTVIINDLIYDLCCNSSLEKGLCFSENMFNKLNKLKKFNYEKIYLEEKQLKSAEYIKFVITNLYETLKISYIDKARVHAISPTLLEDFENWLKDYWNLERENKNKNDVIFDISNEKDYYKAIIYYISGMTDNYAIQMYNSIIEF